MLRPWKMKYVSAAPYAGTGDGHTIVIVGGDRVGSQESYAAAAKQMVILSMNFLFLHLVVDNSHNFLTGL